MKVAIIPARGGSKRIPRKNIKSFAGIPMVGHSILAAKASGLFDHIVVSTDDEEIRGIAKDFGADVPFMRPAELSDDYTPTAPVITHAIKSCQEKGWEVDYACCIYPCAPFLMAEDLKQAFRALDISSADYSFSIAEFPSAIQRALRRNIDGRMSSMNPESELVRTQDLTAAYYDAGQFYWGRADAWLEGKSIHNGGIGQLTPSWRAVDIDTTDDWKRAEILYKVFEEMKK
ncbi:pseudaminic acid cytidylyltransferase [Polynucleobacter paneuropaeus]|nr:pseudaminic acid cytidylyltransferase [Polynucleobacter paneuropaeus]